MTKTQPYISSEILLDSLNRAGESDTLVAEVTAKVTPVQPQLPGQKVFNHRVVPVFVFSLLGLPKDTLFDHKDFFVANKKQVLVLQTGSPAVFLPYFTEDGIVPVNPRSPTRHIVAGIAASLGGITEPFYRYAVERQEMVFDYMWANGRHPFGPFSNTAQLSTIFLDSILRNSVVSRTDASLRVVSDAAQHLQDFTNEYVINPFEEETEFSELDSSLDLWSFLIPNRPTPLAIVVVNRLRAELRQMKQQLQRLANALRKFELQTADEISASLHLAAISFKRYAIEEIRVTREDLQCCKKVHYLKSSVGSSSNTLLYIGCALVGVALFAIVVQVSQFPVVRARSIVVVVLSFLRVLRFGLFSFFFSFFFAVLLLLLQ